jgi:hypothetical protein
MIDYETLLYVVLGGFAATMGIVCASMAAKKSQGLNWAAGRLLVAAAAFPVVVCFFFGFADWHKAKSTTITDAILSALAAALLYGTVFAIACGFLSFTCFAIAYPVLKRCAGLKK